MQFIGRFISLNILNNFPKFILIGIINTIVGYSIIFSLLYLFGINYVISNAVGYLVGICVSFYLNKNYNFKTVSKNINEFCRFCISFIVSFVINNVSLILFIELFDLPKFIAIIMAGCMYTGTFYLLCRMYVFKKPNCLFAIELSNLLMRDYCSATFTFSTSHACSQRNSKQMPQIFQLRSTKYTTDRRIQSMYTEYPYL